MFNFVLEFVILKKLVNRMLEFNVILFKCYFIVDNMWWLLYLKIWDKEYMNKIIYFCIMNVILIFNYDVLDI